MVKILETEYNLTAAPDSSAGGIIRIDTDSAERTSGEIRSDHIRIIPETERFSGRHIRIRFRVDTTGLREGSTVSGSILVVTESGETTIPVRTEILAEEPESSEDRRIRSPEEFAARAESGPDEAFRFFRSAGFPVMLEESCGEDAERLKTLYRGLNVPGCTKEAMEEFLLAAGYKEVVRISADMTDLHFDGIGDSVMETVTLRRSGWGTVRIRAEADGDFIVLTKTEVSDEDFVGRSMNFPFLLRKDRIGRGRRYGRILFTHSHGRIEVTVSASSSKQRTYRPDLQADRKSLEIMEQMTAWSLGKIPDGKLASVLEEPISCVIAARPDSAGEMSLLQAFSCVISGRHSEAQTILRRLDSRDFRNSSEPVLMAREYLEKVSGLNRINRDGFDNSLRSLQEKYPGNALLPELMFRALPEYARYPKRRLKTARAFFEAGCISPLLYARVLTDLMRDTALLSRLDEFMQQVLLFGVRQGVMTEELALRTAYLADNEKQFNRKVFRILASLYRRFPIDGILESVIRLLMKGQMGSRKSFPWFERAVEKDIRIIRLYEYYAESLPETKTAVLPLKIRKYFIYNHTLSADGSVRLYANIARNREKDPDTFAAFRDRIAAFAEESLRSGRISDEYAAVYQAVIRKLPDAASADTMVKALFTEHLYCDDPSIREAVVVQPGLTAEAVFPVISGNAFIRRSSEKAVILLADREGRRYAASVDYVTEPILDSRIFRNMCREQCPDDPEMILSRTEEFLAKDIEDAEAFRIWKKASENPVFSDEYRMEARRFVLKYIALHPENSFFSQLTGWDVLKEYAEADCETLLGILMAGGLYRAAYEVISVFGSEDVPAEQIARLASHMIEECGEERNDGLLKCAADAFRKGKYDEQILRYLTKYLSGSLEEMRAVRLVAASFLPDTAPLDERILSRCIFTRTLIPEMLSVFRDFVMRGENKALTGEFLEFYCMRILHAGGAPDAFTAECAADYINSGRKADFALKLYYLLYASEKETLSEDEETLVTRFLDESLKRGLRFGFYKKFPDKLIAEYRIRDKVFIEQTADPGARVFLTWCLLEEDAGNGEETWQTEPLERRFKGIFSREFTLFYGERLKYRVTVENGGVKTVSEEQTVSVSGEDAEGSSRYCRMNAMLKSMKHGDINETRERIRLYNRAMKASEMLFTLEE